MLLSLMKYLRGPYCFSIKLVGSKQLHVFGRTVFSHLLYKPCSPFSFHPVPYPTVVIRFSFCLHLISSLSQSSKDQSTSLLASPLLRRLPGLEADAITEEGDSPLEEDGENGDGERQGKDNDENKCNGENDEDVNRSKHGQRRDNTSRGVRLLDLRIDNGMERMGSGALRPVSPSSRRESGSPGRISDNRCVRRLLSYTQ